MASHVRSRVRVGPVGCEVSPSGASVTLRPPGPAPHVAVVRVDTDGTHVRLARPSARALSGVAELVPSRPEDLVEMLDAAARRRWSWPWVLAVAGLLAVLVSPLTLLVGVPATAVVAWWDVVRRRIVVFYDVEGPPAARWAELRGAFAGVVGSQGAWHRTDRDIPRATHERKVNAGASRPDDRAPLRWSRDGPAHMASNIEVPTLHAGGRHLYLFPDSVLVRDGARYVGVGYDELGAAAATTRFVEDGEVPTDASVIEWRWRFRNRDGGPDRRFATNREVPVVEYGEVRLTVAPGTTTILTFSRSELAERFAAAIDGMHHAVPGPARTAPEEPAVTLAPERTCTVTGTGNHLDRLRLLLAGSPGPLRTVAELGGCVTAPGRTAVEVRIGGARVGQLPPGLSGRYADDVRAVEQRGLVPTAEATLTDGPRGVRVELRLPG